MGIYSVGAFISPLQLIQVFKNHRYYTFTPTASPFHTERNAERISECVRRRQSNATWQAVDETDFFFYHHYQYFTSSLSNPTKNKLPFQHHKLIIFCMQAFVFDWFDVRIMLTFSIPSADWNGLFVPLDFLSHTQLHLSCKSIPAASRSGEEKRAVGHQWSSSQRTSGEAVP